MEIKETEKLDYNEMPAVPLYVHESTKACLMKIIKWMAIIIALLICVIGYGVYEFTSYDYSDVYLDSDDGGNANYLEAGVNGVINNGEGDSQKKD